MKRISFMILPIAVISLLCGSCADAPESVRSNNQKADTENGQLVYVELPHILDGLDEALAKSYKKFKLPKLEDIDIQIPEKLASLECTYIGADLDFDKLERLTVSFANCFDIKSSPKRAEPMGIEITENEKTADGMFYSMFCYRDYGHSGIALPEMAKQPERKLVYSPALNKTTDDPVITNIAEQSSKTTDRVYSELHIPFDFRFDKAVELKIGDITSYECYMQRSYRGVDFFSFCTLAQGYNDEDNRIMYDLMKDVFHYEKDGDLFGCEYPSFFDIKETAVGKYIPLSQAIGMLEDELAEYVRFEFDDIRLVYIPKGKAINLLDREGRLLPQSELDPTLKCEPCYVFCMYEDGREAELYENIRFVSVNCITGETEVYV